MEPNNRLSAAEIIKRVLMYQDPDTWLCIGEIASQARGMGFYIGTSDNSVGTRLPEMSRKGAIEGRVRAGENYKEWRGKIGMGIKK